MTLAELLKGRGIREALIVDDACDAIPTAADMGTAADGWAVFNDDLDPDQRALILERYPASMGRRFDELTRDNGYVAAIWELREELGAVTEPLFEIYVANQSADERYVELARKRLEAVGLTCVTRGRDFADQAQKADLILIDLYFGGAQDDAALQESKLLLASALESRAANPPLVILMSRSERLELKRDEFRDDVRLVDSGFRIIRKADLEDGDRLERQLERLADNAEDTRRLARFLAALQDGIDDAAARTLTLMRNLKLSDIGQIQQLLLDVEGEPTGSYLVDVFDRVLQHEVEADTGIIDAAIGLNDFSSARHPPPYVAGSSDLQELVERLLTQNPERLKLPGSIGSLVTFGDLLRPLAGAEGEPVALPLEMATDTVLVVLTPVCDLQRGEAPRVLMLVGTLKPLTVKDWSYGPGARTPAIRLDGEMFSIKWNLKHLETLSWSQLDQAIGSGALRVAARLREAHAIELQQRVLSGLGRVGLVAPMPATFAVGIEAYFAGVDGVPSRLEIAALADGAVCFVGRDDAGEPNLRLVLTEGGCDGLQDALDTLDEDRVAEKARTALGHIKSSGDLGRMLAAGIDLKGVSDTGWTLLNSETGADKGVPKMGLLAWNFRFPVTPLDPKQLNKAGVILLIKDAPKEGAVGLGEAIRLGILSPDPDPAAPSPRVAGKKAKGAGEAAEPAAPQPR